MDRQSPPRLSSIFKDLEERAEQKNLHLSELLKIFGARGHGLFVLFLTLPFAQPVPLLGLSTPFGAAIATLGVFMLLGKPPWLPARIRRIEIPASMVRDICRALQRLLARSEKYIKPRLLFLIDSPSHQGAVGGLIALNGALLALPLPVPFSNFFPAITLVLLSVATLEEDGLILLLAYVLACVTLLFFAAIVVLPLLGLQLLASQ